MHEETAYLFEVVNPIGFSVRTTADYWAMIEGKHPEVAGRQQDVQVCLRTPDQIRQSKRDRAIYLFYHAQPPYHLCVVVKRLNGTGFVVTCYLTDSMKEGGRIWP